MSQINVTIRLDKEIKENAEELFRALGMNFSTAVNIFARQALRQGKIPFEIADPFYSASNMAVLHQSLKDTTQGKLTAHEIIED